MAAYALTIFTGAFLLFQVQPVIGKYILPWFGGGPGVWTTCMLFFQVVLLGGYAYAHLTSRWLKLRTQAMVHLVLLAAALALLPITPADSWKPHGGGDPTVQILALLAASLGLPYFVLSSTSPLIQQWLSCTRPGNSPYRLYALSNVGSLLALVSYPFFFEPHFTRKIQAALWAWGLVAYVVCCGFCAIGLWKSEVQNPEVEATRARRTTRRTLPASVNSQPSAFNRLLWLLLPTCASVLLLATTNALCQDVAVIPFLWVAPLALYLLSFVICFDSSRWYGRYPFALALVAVLGGLCWAMLNGSELALSRQVPVYCGGLFICCMVCHGELYRLKPDPRHLTAYYLMIAAGGALGGLLVAVAAPLLFRDYYELHLGLLFCGLLFLLVCIAAPAGSPGSEVRSLKWNEWRWLAGTLTLLVFGGLDRLLAWLPAHAEPIPEGFFAGCRIALWSVLVLGVAFGIARRKLQSFRHWRLLTCVWLSLGLLAFGAILWKDVHDAGGKRVFCSRSFYGVLKVHEHEKNDPTSHYFLLLHGQITHGLQFTDPARAMWPVSYYGAKSGIALGVAALPTGPRRIGVVGLGAGTMAAFGRAGDCLRFYEINPQVQSVATSWFSYLSKSAAMVEVVLGDARLSLEREPPQHFDLLALDAFSGDAIPVHLLTKEAFEVYQRHLNADGIIAVHISNDGLDLKPVVVNLARHFGYKLAFIHHEEPGGPWWLYPSTWVLLSRSEQIIDSPAIRSAASAVNTHDSKVALWTDDFASLFQILR